MLIASRLHFTPPLRPFRFTCLSAVYHGLHFSLYPLPSPCSAIDDRSAQFRWLLCGRRRLLTNGQQYRASGVTVEKNIARYRYYPIHANIAQYPITQYRYRSNPSILHIILQGGVMVLSTTHRYRKKYITTLLYKPITS